MDEKFMNRIESFRRSLDALNEAKERDMNDSFVLSGTSAKFSITFDLSWKVMKDILIQHYMSPNRRFDDLREHQRASSYAVTDFVAGSPREVLRKAFQTELISSDIWTEMLNVRNRLIHDYDCETIKEYCGKIVDVYIDIFYKFRNVIEQLGFL